MAKHITENTITLRIPTDLLKKVEDFSFGHRIRSRNKAIMDLIEDGLRANRVSLPEPDGEQ